MSFMNGHALLFTKLVFEAATTTQRAHQHQHLSTSKRSRSNPERLLKSSDTTSEWTNYMHSTNLGFLLA